MMLSLIFLPISFNFYMFNGCILASHYITLSMGRWYINLINNHLDAYSAQCCAMYVNKLKYILRLLPRCSAGCDCKCTTHTFSLSSPSPNVLAFTLRDLKSRTSPLFDFLVQVLYYLANKCEAFKLRWTTYGQFH